MDLTESMDLVEPMCLTEPTEPIDTIKMSSSSTISTAYLTKEYIKTRINNVFNNSKIIQIRKIKFLISPKMYDHSLIYQLFNHHFISSLSINLII